MYFLSFFRNNPNTANGLTAIAKAKTFGKLVRQKNTKPFCPKYRKDCYCKRIKVCKIKEKSECVFPDLFCSRYNLCKDKRFRGE